MLYGPESSGKTTLSRKLAEYYSTLWIPEYAREYLQNKWNREQKICEPEDLIPIAEGQMKLENDASAKMAADKTQFNSDGTKGENLLFCDTDLLETMVYSEAYYGGWIPEMLQEYALANTYDLYLLTYVDTPWEKDDLRDRPGQREEMFAYFKNALIKYDRPYIELRGSLENRLKTAVEHIKTLLV